MRRAPPPRARGFGDDPGYEVMPVELYDPVFDLWTTLGELRHGRSYHTTALLLPDGRIWVAGSSPGQNTQFEQVVELFSPPYLFRGPRPRVTVSSGSRRVVGWFSFPEIHYEPRLPLQVTVDDYRAIDRFVIVRCSSSTHAFNPDQRLIHLHHEGAGNNEALVHGPAHGAPPGWYMLFALNKLEVPSVGQFVFLT
jgi:galactose oxidase